MKNEDKIEDLFLQNLKQLVLDVSQLKNNKVKRPYSFKQKL